MKKLRLYFTLSILFFIIGSSSIMAMPATRDIANSSNRISLLINGLWFWIAFIAGYVFAWLASRERKKNTTTVSEKPGILLFFSNAFAIIFDLVMLFSFLIFMIMVFSGQTGSFISYIVLSLLVLSIHLHAMLNGLIFKSFYISAKEEE